MGSWRSLLRDLSRDLLRAKIEVLGVLGSVVVEGLWGIHEDALLGGGVAATGDVVRWRKVASWTYAGGSGARAGECAGGIGGMACESL